MAVLCEAEVQVVLIWLVENYIPSCDRGVICNTDCIMSMQANPVRIYYQTGFFVLFIIKSCVMATVIIIVVIIRIITTILRNKEVNQLIKRRFTKIRIKNG